MDFWVLEDRDRFLREGAHSCHVEAMEPLNVKPSTAKCPKCGALLEPGIWAPPRKARVSGKSCGDLILGPTFELILSERAAQVFAAEGIRGLDVLGRIETVPPLASAYVAARPRVTVTHLDEARSKVVWRRAPSCDVCRLGWREQTDGFALDESTWDGSDVFMASGVYGVMIVTARFVDVVQKHGLTNFRFLRTEAYRDRLGTIPDELVP